VVAEGGIESKVDQQTDRYAERSEDGEEHVEVEVEFQWCEVVGNESRRLAHQETEDFTRLFEEWEGEAACRFFTNDVPEDAGRRASEFAECLADTTRQRADD